MRLPLTTATVSALYRIGNQRLNPYIAAGLGAGWLSHALRVPDVTVKATAFGVNVGVGATYTLSPRLLARADVRYTNPMHGTAPMPNSFWR